MDNFTIAVLAGAAVVTVIFALMFVLDKGSTKQPQSPTSVPPKPAGKRPA